MYRATHILPDVYWNQNTIDNKYLYQYGKITMDRTHQHTKNRHTAKRLRKKYFIQQIHRLEVAAEAEAMPLLTKACQLPRASQLRGQRLQLQQA